MKQYLLPIMGKNFSHILWTVIICSCFRSNSRCVCLSICKIQINNHCNNSHDYCLLGVRDLLGALLIWSLILSDTFQECLCASFINKWSTAIGFVTLKGRQSGCQWPWLIGDFLALPSAQTLTFIIQQRVGLRYESYSPSLQWRFGQPQTYWLT